MKPLDYSKRLSKFKKNMEKNNIELSLITPSVNFGYLFKGFFEMSERLICAAIPLNDDPILIAPSFEEERMQRSTNIDNIITWSESENPFDKLKESVDFVPQTISLESTAVFSFYLRFQKVFSNSKFQDISDIINPLRSVKSQAEIERMEQACKYTVRTINEIVDSFEEGITEQALLKKVTERMSELSNEPSWALVQFDENSAIPHGSASAKKLKKGSVVLIDTGTSVDHYFSDITVTTPFGKPTSKFLEIYEIVQEANDAALEKSKEGTIAEDVDAAARDVIEKAGYGKYFTHRLGHGLGLDVHEEPYIVKGNKRKLVEGNTHSDEPGIYIPGEFGIRIEDDVLVGKKSSRRIYSFDRAFWER